MTSTYVRYREIRLLGAKIVLPNSFEITWLQEITARCKVWAVIKLVTEITLQIMPGDLGGKRMLGYGQSEIKTCAPKTTMYLFRALVLGILFVIHSVTGHSTRVRKPDHAAPLNDVRLEISSPSFQTTGRFNLTFAVAKHDSKIQLQLKPNSVILPSDAYIRYLDTNGALKQIESLDKEQGRIFHGTAWVSFSNGSWCLAGRARIYLLNDGNNLLFEGNVGLFNQNFGLKPSTRAAYGLNQSNAQMEIIGATDALTYLREMRDQGILQGGPSSSAIASDLGGPITHTATMPRQYQGDYREINQSIGSRDGCPTTPKIALIGLATDCAYRAAFASVEEMRRGILGMVNAASEVFERNLNISLAIRNLTISDEGCPEHGSSSTPWNAACSAGDINWRLAQFALWRQSQDETNAY
ncbi:uncharacterized protein BP01DRAFT_387605 [Aspergillus saccharolyticus JOP 1030-1]|uniref:Peptidase M12B domain-containing protein n=1 Tax=Aspergillus saccharolyticus JOP 1030-1 TaxID=1450539 RepID=A0A318Z1C2_9EURO|nr:hypothetical protein BP01DRAFT_387605 [Aspergillus saccharolyticus JOP 1030-1]PYH40174.1 hypothetical protein BP01DRAFT_387605 [Aspergillus saccharolyticus JOP 1030-1]